MKPNHRIRCSQLSAQLGHLSSTFSAPRSHPPKACCSPQGVVTHLPHSPTPLNNSAPTIRLSSAFLGGLRQCISHWKSNMLLINRTTLANATWRNAGGGSSQRRTPTVWCAFSLFCAKGKTAEHADFSSLNWHSWCWCTHTHTHAHTSVHTHFMEIREPGCVRKPCMKSTELHVFIVNVGSWREKMKEKETRQNGLLLLSIQQHKHKHTHSPCWQRQGLMFGWLCC